MSDANTQHANRNPNAAQLIQPSTAPPQGVGGRQQAAPHPLRGGGYLPICTGSEVPVSARAAAATDRRLAELREMGLHPLWVMAAAVIGWDAFVAQWEVFSAHETLLDGRNRITLPSIETYRRFQRNEAIRGMLRAGAGAEEVCARLQEVHSRPPKLSTVRRMMRRMAADECKDRSALCQGQLFEPG